MKRNETGRGLEMAMEEKMIYDLRKKFMAVTMSLLFLVFSVFFIFTYLDNQYWYELETAENLDWIAESGVFTGKGNAENRALIDEITESDNGPVAGIVTDINGKIISYQNIGRERKCKIDQDTIDGILSDKNTSRKYGSYVYSVKSLDDSRFLIVVQDISQKSFKPHRLFGISVMVLMVIAALIMITYFLSGFIIEPARKAIEREKQFVADASHELKTPVSAISINAQALNMEYSDIHVRNILSETERLTRLLEKLLTLSRIDEVPLADKKKCCLSDIVQEIALTYESVAFEKNETYSFETQAGIFVSGDEDELRQLTAILIDNAIKNSGQSGMVEILLKKDGRKAVLTVSNNGNGIAEKDIPHIFDRFYKSGSPGSESSYGLGLSIAKAITERHKGKITVKSIKNEKTVFTVVFYT